MILPPEEPQFAPWKVVSLEAFTRSIQNELPGNRPGILAVDGRSAGGKTTLAERIHKAVPGSAIVHTDDIPSSAAWLGQDSYSPPANAASSFYDWTERARENILKPTRSGQVLKHRPPSWTDWLRAEGAFIEVPLGCPLLIFEGVGAARRELTDMLDLAVWIQSDIEKAESRGIARDGGNAEVTTFWKKWMAEEFPFLAEQRPWDRADFIVSGTPELEHDPISEVVVAVGSRTLP